MTAPFPGCITIDDVTQARDRLSSILEKTPVVHSSALSTPQQDIYLKLEILQRTGAFKLRGAFNKIATLTDEEKKTGVCASSAGNHAQGVAFSAQHFGIPATIVMPESTPLAKIQNTRSYGANVVLKGAIYDDAAAYCDKLQKENGYTYIHPFNDPTIIAGQGTVALEILEQVKNCDCIVAPIGGGGLCAGIAVAARAINPSVKVIGVQSETAASMRTSLEQGKVTSLEVAKTIADGIQVRTPGDLTFKYMQEFQVDVVTVSEETISAAILFLMEKQHIICEGAGAVPVAAVMSGKIPSQYKKVCLLLSGGNIDIGFVSNVIDHGLMLQQRRVHLSVWLSDAVGAMKDLVSTISEEGASIFMISQTRQKVDLKLREQVVELVIDTTGPDHRVAVLQALRNKNYVVKEE